MVPANSSVTQVFASGSVTGTQATSALPASYVVSAADFSEDSNEELPPIGGEALCLLNATVGQLPELCTYIMYIHIRIHKLICVYSYVMHVCTSCASSRL